MSRSTPTLRWEAAISCSTIWSVASFQQDEGGEGQVVLVTPLLVGTDGVKKMSKSLGNYIALTDPPGGDGGMFGKVMKLPDTLMDSYYTLLTDLPDAEFKPLIASNPRDAKVALAKHLITWLHDGRVGRYRRKVVHGCNSPPNPRRNAGADVIRTRSVQARAADGAGRHGGI